MADVERKQSKNDNEYEARDERCCELNTLFLVQLLIETSGISRKPLEAENHQGWHILGDATEFY